MPSFAAQQSLFRAYDIRGARQLFTSEFIQALGMAFASLYQPKNQLSTYKDTATKDTDIKDTDIKDTDTGIQTSCDTNTTIVIGYDVRNDSDTISQTLAHILQSQGFSVVQLGLVTTPMMAFWAQQYDGHGINVTASHSEKHTLGIKWLVGNDSPTDSEIQALYHSLADAEHTKNTDARPHFKTNSIHKNSVKSTSEIITLPSDIVASRYIDTIAQIFGLIKKQNPNLANSQKREIKRPVTQLDLTVVIDCMNGATSRIAQPLFERFCKKVILLNDIPDGNFPTGNPDPTETNRLAELQQTVMVNAADMGLAFDGDGDRLMIVDNSGKVVTPDHLLYLLAQVAIMERSARPALSNKTNSKKVEHHSAPEVIFDVKCSHHLPKLIENLNAIPVMSKTGSSLLRQQLQARGRLAIFAGELSGHFIFNDGYFIMYDDAMYAGLRLLHWLATTATQSDIIALLRAEDKTIDATLPLSTDLWGAPKRATLPYRLTDITQYLPKLVNTADIYLPLSDNDSETCSAVEHLTALCHYLQYLIAHSSFDSKTANTAYKQTDISSCHTASFAEKTPQTNPFKPPSLCDCYSDTASITLAQAQRLLPAGTRLTSIDGVRLDFDNGFGVLRESNTSHSLTVRFAGDSVADLQDVQARFVALCRSFDQALAEEIATIRPDF